MVKTKNKTNDTFLRIFSAVALFLGYLCFFSGRFYVSTFGKLGFDAVLYTLSASLGGVQSGQVTRWLLLGFLPALLLSILTFLLLGKIRFPKNGKYSKVKHSTKCGSCFFKIIFIVSAHHPASSPHP